ncbi:hypothetical protein I5H94_gp055 [Mycobacterium phage SwagPigglett]|nr:hypothetical protein PBI_SAAL_52 [Mycobacterium phage Saal]YP_009954841.1 hypothetical protein I5H16_gp053 [Mycobacterium phage BobaPhett]YP_009956291.1 hypothetical protein I5H30_gp053 [Mycobacterium phage DRBy19]YP_009959519.1 hypothetical protein I5H61_gp053 [Mycobacterium phage Mattes]YP_009962928.1 hypothetical protein I5H94_gp055 [Mycobacterium phage SwagPigglett]AXC37222.1 hypothetical protein SEA_BYCHANCE_41 [Mycobacterium phage ByChance]QBI98907.1 hypothetical protein SEA_JAMES_53
MSDTKINQEDIEKAVLQIVERDGVCAPETLVEEAADPNHPLHNAFEWNDDAAAREHRKYQARKLIARVRIEVRGTSTPRFVSVSIKGKNNTRHEGYAPVEQALSDQDLAAQVYSAARAGLDGWRRRLAAFDEATAAVESITAAMDALPTTN